MKRSMVLIASVILSTVLTSCIPNTNQIRRMQALEEGVDNPTTVVELTSAISKYQNRIEDILNADIKIGLWYKILATRYLDTKMYGKALETFRKAIDYYPTNQNLYYYVGMCAGYMAKSALDYDATGSSAERDRYLALSESAYLRALELEPRYVRALYGISVLYVFELKSPAKAIPYLELIMDIEKQDVDAMFILARAYYQTGAYDSAAAMYDKIIISTPEEKRKKEAETNKAKVLEEAYGQN